MALPEAAQRHNDNPRVNRRTSSSKKKRFLDIYDSQIRRIIRTGELHGEELALTLPMPSSASQWPNLLNHGEQKGGGQSE